MIKRIFYLILLLLFSTHTNAQIYSRTQLNVLEKTLVGKEDTARVNTLLSLSEAYIQFQLDTALIYAQKAEIESKELAYDWGYYKSLYCQAAINFHNISGNELKLIVEKCSKWFDTNNYEADAIYCEILLSDISYNLEGKEFAREKRELILKRAIKLNKIKPLAKSWNALKNHNSHFVDPDPFLRSQDSAIVYFNLMKDSVNIIYVNLYNTLPINGRGEAFECSYQSLEIAERWGNLKLISGANQYIGQGWASMMELDTALYFLNQSLEYAKKINSSLLQLKTIQIKAYAYYKIDSVELALQYYQEALQVSEKMNLKSSSVSLYQYIGYMYQKMGENRLALNAFLRAYEYAKELNFSYYIISLKHSVANIYTLTKEYEKAEQMLLENVEEINVFLIGVTRDKMRANVYDELGDLYLMQDRFKEAIHYYWLAVKDLEDDKRSIRPHIAIVLAHLYQNNFDKAEEVYNEIIIKYKEKILQATVDFSYAKGRLLIEKKDYLGGIASLRKYLKKSPAIGVDYSRQEAYFQLYRAYKATGKYKKALNSYVSYKAIEDSLRANKVVESIEKIQATYELSEKEATITDLKQKQELQELRLGQQNSELELRKLYIILFGIFALLVAIVSFWLFYRFRSKKQQEEIEAKTKRTELELENLQAKQQVEIAQVKNQLFANVSHEFRTPLTLIQVPLKNYLSKIPADDQPIFESVLNNTDDLLKMVDELLELSRMESGTVQLNKTVFDLSTFFAPIKSNFALLFSNKNIEFSWNNLVTDHCFNADENRIKIVLNNLLKNAYSHTPEHGKIEVVIDYIEKSSMLHLIISNTGDGIAAKDLPFIFDRHYRANEEKYTGNGIGLSLSKQIVEMHQGEITVDSDQEKGTVFHVKLPGELLAKSEALIDTYTPTISDKNNLLPNGDDLNNDFNQAELLIVEDTPEIRDLLHSTLKDDFNLSFAEDGEEGEQKALKQQPDLVLSDVMMPKKDGFELLNVLKNNIATSHIPVILLTAKAGTENRISGLEMDADDYISKPFDPKELIARIHNILRQRKKLQELFNQNPLLFSKQIKCTSLDAEFLNKARSIMDQNFSNGDFSVDQFCKELALNRNSVHNKMKAFTNQNTSQYIRNFRLEKAVELLVGSHTSINDIFIETGFNSPQAFNKAFKERFTVTPTEYRKEHQKNGS